MAILAEMTLEGPDDTAVHDDQHRPAVVGVPDVVEGDEHPVEQRVVGLVPAGRSPESSAPGQRSSISARV